MIKNIVFDIGEVLMSYQWTYVLEMSGMSVEESNRVGMLIFADPIWTEMDRGELSLMEARQQYRLKYPKEAAGIDYFLEHPELMPIPRRDIWEYVAALKEQGYSLYVLSNYSKELLQMHTGDADFWKYMDGGVVSYEVGVCKPSPEIYRILLERYSLVPDECLFFDDREENIEGALKMGMNGVWVTSKETLTTELERLLRNEN